MRFAIERTWDRNRALGLAILLGAYLLMGRTARAGDWPTYAGDNARTAVTDESFKTPLEIDWRYTPLQPPKPAWDGGPAKNDYWHRLKEMEPKATYDRAYHVAVAGDSVYFGASADDKVVCLDANTGKTKWVFYTEGPVRLAPAFADGKVYFGSDAGWATCLDARDGSLIWTYRAVQEDYRLLGNGRMISLWPIRTGVLVQNGVAYFAAGMFAKEGVDLCALDADTGALVWKKKIDAHPEGYLLASATHLYMPTGRTTPIRYSLADGELRGLVAGEGGAYALLPQDDFFVSGPGKIGKLTAVNPITKEEIATFDGLRMIVTPRMSYLETKDSISALDRQKFIDSSRQKAQLIDQRRKLQRRLGRAEKENNQKELAELGKRLAAVSIQLGEAQESLASSMPWSVPIAYHYSLILAGDTLVAGGDHEVAAISAADGRTLWTGAVSGRAYGLAVAHGRLFVSTDDGSIFAFREAGSARAQEDIAALSGLEAAPSSTAPRGPFKMTALEGADSRAFIVDGPYVHFAGGGEVQVFWQTRRPGSSILEYVDAQGEQQRLEDNQPKTHHEVILAGLEPSIEYPYRIKSRVDQTEFSSEPYVFDSTYDDSPGAFPDIDSPYPADELTALYEQAAERIIKDTGIEKGYCLVYGFGEGRLAYELARRTNLKVIGVDDDSERIARARKRLDQTGVYGERISVLKCSMDKLPFGKYFANLIVSDRLLLDGTMPVSTQELWRVLRPNGGVIMLAQSQKAVSDHADTILSGLSKEGEARIADAAESNGLFWERADRGPLSNGGEWTHLYGNASNTTSSSNAHLQTSMRALWFGRPGPRLMVDRHHRPISSLVKDGRMFIPGDDRIIAIDHFNGTRLWDLSVPGSRRVGVMKDCGQMVLTHDSIYIAAMNRCRAVNVATGEPGMTMTAPQLDADTMRDWGYLAAVDGKIVGSAQQPGASFHTFAFRDSELHPYNLLEGDFKDVIISDYLFAKDQQTGRTLWTHRDGIIMNSAIAIGDGRVYFVEKRGAGMDEDWNGRMPVNKFCDGGDWLIGLDLETGKKVFQTRVELPYEHIMYLSFAEGTLLLTGSHNIGQHVVYSLLAFEAKTGEPKWNNRFVGKEIGGTHGEQWQRPVIISDTIYLRPFDFNLTTGEKGALDLSRAGHGCGGLTGAGHYLFGRGNSPQLYDLTRGGKNTPLTDHTRPGCWINIIPAGGLALIPESSSGCSCAYSFQTSMAFASR